MTSHTLTRYTWQYASLSAQRAWSIGRLSGLIKTFRLKWSTLSPRPLREHSTARCWHWAMISPPAGLSWWRWNDLTFTPDGDLKGIIRKGKTDQYWRGRLVFESDMSAKLVKKWLRLKPQKIHHLFCAINQNQCLDRAICERSVNEIIKRSIVKVLTSSI